MTNWPSIAIPSDLRERTVKEQIKNDFAAGYVSSRPKWNRSRKKFELSWNMLPDTDKSTLETFFDDNVGGTFTWTHPISDIEYTVMFIDDELNFDYVPVNYWGGTINLEEQ